MGIQSAPRGRGYQRRARDEWLESFASGLMKSRPAFVSIHLRDELPFPALSPLLERIAPCGAQVILVGKGIEFYKSVPAPESGQRIDEWLAEQKLAGTVQPGKER